MLRVCSSNAPKRRSRSSGAISVAASCSPNRWFKSARKAPASAGSAARAPDPASAIRTTAATKRVIRYKAHGRVSTALGGLPNLVSRPDELIIGTLARSRLGRDFAPIFSGKARIWRPKGESTALALGRVLTRPSTRPSKCAGAPRVRRRMVPRCAMLRSQDDRENQPQSPFTVSRLSGFVSVIIALKLPNR